MTGYRSLRVATALLAAVVVGLLLAGGLGSSPQNLKNEARLGLARLRGAASQFVRHFRPSDRPAPYIADWVVLDYVRWLETGFLSETIGEYVTYKDRYQPIDAYAFAKILPWTRQSGQQYGPYFGSRVLVLDVGGVAQGVISHNHLSCGYHRCFSALVPVELLRQKAPRPTANGAGAVRIVNPDGMGRYNAPLGFNSADFDGDGKADFIMDERLILSSRVNEGAGIDLAAFSRGGVGRGVFAERGGRVVLVVPDDGRRLKILENRVGGAPRTVATMDLPAATGTIPELAPQVVVPLGGNRVLVRTASHVVLVDVDSGAMHPVAWDIPSVAGPYEHRFGAVGDFTGDGVTDLWFAVRGRGGQDGFALLLDGAKLAQAPKASQATILRIDAPTGPGAEDGIGSSVSLWAGDIDGDGRPDFTIASHYELSMTGTLYVVPGSLIAKAAKAGDPAGVDLMGCGVLRLRAGLAGELAPPFFHRDDVDLTGDGIPDLVIAADNDGEAGHSSGAVYVLDGAKLAAGLGSARCTDERTE